MLNQPAFALGAEKFGAMGKVKNGVIMAQKAKNLRRVGQWFRIAGQHLFKIGFHQRAVQVNHEQASLGGAAAHQKTRRRPGVPVCGVYHFNLKTVVSGRWRHKRSFRKTFPVRYNSGVRSAVKGEENRAVFFIPEKTSRLKSNPESHLLAGQGKSILWLQQVSVVHPQRIGNPRASASARHGQNRQRCADDPAAKRSLEIANYHAGDCTAMAAEHNIHCHTALASHKDMLLASDNNCQKHGTKNSRLAIRDSRFSTTPNLAQWCYINVHPAVWRAEV